MASLGIGKYCRKNPMPKSKNTEENKKPATDQLDEYISLKDASGLCLYSQEYISLLARKGLIESKKMGRNWVITKRALFDYIKKNSVEKKGNHKGIFKADEQFKLAFSQNLLTRTLPDLAKQVWIESAKAMAELGDFVKKSFKTILFGHESFSSGLAGWFKAVCFKKFLAVLSLVLMAAVSLYVFPVAAHYYKKDLDSFLRLADITLGRSFRSAKVSFEKTVVVYQDTLSFVKNPDWASARIAEKYLAVGFKNLGRDILDGTILLSEDFSKKYLAGSYQKLSRLANQLGTLTTEYFVSPVNYRSLASLTAELKNTSLAGKIFKILACPKITRFTSLGKIDSIFFLKKSVMS